MAKAKQGDLFSCIECGLVVVVDEACGCAAAEIVCCDQPMAKGKLAAAKVKKKAAAPKSSAAKTVKAVVKPKAAIKPKTAVKPKAAAAKAPVKKAVAKKAPAKKTAKK